MTLFFLFLFSPVITLHARNITSSASLGYARLYDYQSPDQSAINHHVLRFDALLYKDRFLLESDLQLFISPKMEYNNFLLIVGGYQVIQEKIFPRTYLLISFLHSTPFSLNLENNMRRNTPGLGFQFDFDLAWLTRGEGRFAMNYYPLSGLLYKSMHFGWDFCRFMGFKIGGIGVRTRYGRQYSGFMFELCHRIN